MSDVKIPHPLKKPTHHRDDILQQMGLSNRHTHHPILRRVYDMHVKMIYSRAPISDDTVRQRAHRDKTDLRTIGRLVMDVHP